MGINRRDFIRSSFAVGAGLALTSSYTASASVEDMSFESKVYDGWDDAIKEDVVRSEISNLSKKWGIGFRKHSRDDVRVFSEFKPGTYGGDLKYEDLVILRGSLRSCDEEKSNPSGRFIVACVSGRNRYTLVNRFNIRE